MRQILLFFFILISLGNQILSNEFQFTPININFKGIANSGDTIIAFGDFGSMLISYDNAKNWEQKRIFEKGGIIKVFFKDNRITAFSDLGEIALSNDGGKKWNLEVNLNLPIVAVIQSPGGYVIRTIFELITISKDFEVLNSTPLISNIHQFLREYAYSFSLTIFKDMIIAETEKANYMIYNLNLNIIDTLSIEKQGLCTKCNGGLQVTSDTNYFYFIVDKILYRSNDLKSIEKLYEFDGYFFKFWLSNNFIFFVKIRGLSPPSNIILYRIVETDSAITISDCNLDGNFGVISMCDFASTNNKIYLVGNRKFIASLNLSENTAEQISNFTSPNYYMDPDMINDSTFLFYSGIYDEYYYRHFFITNNSGKLINPTLDIEKHPKFYNRYLTFSYKYFEIETQRLFFIGNRNSVYSEILISCDLGQSFQIREDTLYSLGTSHFPFVNIYKSGNRFITAKNWNNRTNYPMILNFNDNFDVTDIYRDSNFVIYYINSKNLDNYLMLCHNDIDSIYEIKYTDSRGQSWDIIKKYNHPDSLLHYKEFQFKGKEFLGIFMFDKIDTTVSLDIFDIENKSIERVYSYKVDSIYQESFIHNSLDCVDDTIYIPIEDTLFYTTDMYDRTKWKYYLFPFNGYITRTFKKFNDVFYARYQDDIHLPNIYWIRINEDIPKPSPTILTEDTDFGQYDISNLDSLSKILRVYNNSADAELIITGYSNLNDSAFTYNLPEITVDNPLVLNPQNNFEFEIYFKPTEAKKYVDSIIFYSNAFETDSICYLNGEGIDTTTSVIDYAINYQNYLYCFPPYPIPATNIVRSLIYWDTSIEIENDDIAVYDIYGNKVSGKEKIKIDKQNTYSGILKWDCSDVSDGMYLIRIIHGTKTWTLKVIVNK
ncbi:MAG: T9SS type A sorting domain-containing protein [bacterium]